jgi:hypothetical protein
MDKKIIMHIDANSAYLSWSAVHALQHGSPDDFRDILQLLAVIRQPDMVFVLYAASLRKNMGSRPANH